MDKIKLSYALSTMCCLILLYVGGDSVRKNPSPLSTSSATRLSQFK